jgi:arylformamidase
VDMIDISMVISPEMPTYKGITERKPIIEVTNTIDQGSNESRLSILHHTGTHVDAPFHMLSQGKTIDLYPLQHFEGKAIVLELSNLEKIEVEHLLPYETKISTVNFLLLKTDNSLQQLHPKKFVFLGESGAGFLSKRFLKGVGIDSLGIERDQPQHPTHRLLLENDILIFEGLVLSHVNPGFYWFSGYPLKIKAADGSPIRAFLRTISNE